MPLIDHPILLFFVACAVLLLSHEIGFRLRAFAANRDDKEWEKEVQSTRNQIAILLSLLIGFSMSMALGRFDERKKLVVDEANAIGTAYLRASMQAAPIRTKGPALLREYVDARITVFGRDRPQQARGDSAKRSKDIQDELWSGAIAASEQTPTPIVAMYAQSLNEMIDLDSKRIAAINNRIPTDIWLLLSTLAIMTSAVVGYGQRHRAVMATFVPVLMIAIAASLIADLDTPVTGFIQVNQQSLHSLRADLNISAAAR
ncbi:hypothetical protein [Dyella subtropica]|uniref:bestrophin-like domain n=1 Tax=Dyella subtropica TaxID=2992127 RepID=UPI002251C748|nr:hypothetical protein [Dyella subtropica]